MEPKKHKELKKFCVIVHFEGAMNYFIDADTEEEAVVRAENMFGKETAEKVMESIASSKATECEEIKPQKKRK